MDGCHCEVWQGRSFVRTSATEDCVRVYANAGREIAADGKWGLAIAALITADEWHLFRTGCARIRLLERRPLLRRCRTVGRDRGFTFRLQSMTLGVVVMDGCGRIDGLVAFSG